MLYEVITQLTKAIMHQEADETGLSPAWLYQDLPRIWNTPVISHQEAVTASFMMMNGFLLVLPRSHLVSIHSWQSPEKQTMSLTGQRLRKGRQLFFDGCRNNFV